MPSKTLTVIFITALLLVLTGAAAATTVQTNSQSASETVEGAFIPVGPETVGEYETLQNQLSATFGLEERSNTSILVTPNGEQYIVFSNAPTLAGHASVTGQLITASQAGTDRGVIFADNVDLHRNGQLVPFATLRENPEAFAGEVVAIDATISRASIEVETEAGVREPLHVGFLSNEELEPPAVYTNPTAGALTGTVNASSSDLGGGSPRGSLASTIAQPVNPENVIVVTGMNDAMWTHGHATTHVLVIPGENSPILLALDTDMMGTRTSPSIASNLSGQLVTVSGNYIGAQVSTKRTLVNSLRCAPDSITNPITGCFPLVTDTTVHAGIVAGDDISNALPVVGLSNEQVDGIARPEQGSYEISGRVVSADEVSFNTSASAVLVAYEMERTGDLELDNGAESIIQDRAYDLETSVSNALVQQAQENPSTWTRREQQSDTADNTSTATATSTVTSTQPTATPTSSRPDSPSATATESAVVGQSNDQINGSTPGPLDALLLLGAVTLSISAVVLEGLRRIKRRRFGDVSTSYVASYSLFIASLPLYVAAGLALSIPLLAGFGAIGLLIVLFLYSLASIYSAL